VLSRIRLEVQRFADRRDDRSLQMPLLPPVRSQNLEQEPLREQQRTSKGPARGDARLGCQLGYDPVQRRAQ